MSATNVRSVFRLSSLIGFVQDPSALSWSAEHDASWPSLSLLLCTSKSKSALLPVGVIEAALMYTHQASALRMRSWDRPTIQAYLAWQRNFGLVGDAPRRPSFGLGFIDPPDVEFNSLFRGWKEALAIEG